MSPKFRTVLTYSMLAVMLLLGPTALALDQSEDTGSFHSINTDDLKIEFYVQPAKGPQIRARENLKVGFRLSDRQSGEAASHLHPAAWMTLRRQAGDKPDKETCEGKIAALLRKGIIQAKADADLNSFFILTLNADSSIGIIDPTVNLNTANLLSLIRFKGEAAEWVLDEERGRIFITLPDEGDVAVIDIEQRTLHSYLQVGSGPRRILLPPEGRYVWVGSDSAGTVTAIDRESLSIVHTFQAGAGPFDIVVDDKNRFAFIGSGREGMVSIVDMRQMEPVGRLELGAGDLTLAWSPLSAMLYAANAKNGTLDVIDPASGKSVNRIDLGTGVTALRSTPDGRFLLALSPARRKIQVIDTAYNRMVGALNTETDPDHILFTADFAYIRNRGTANISVIPLKGLEDPSRAAVLSVPFGAVPPGEVKSPSGINTMELYPHGGHILAVNPADRIVYLYMEGMMVPMSSFKTYTDRPLGLTVYQRGLRERKTEGEYSTTVRLEEPGTYDVPFFLDSPRVAACFEVAVQANPEAEKNRPPKPAFSSQFNEIRFRKGEVAKLRFRLHDERSGAPMPDVKDIEVMSLLKDSHWQHRAAAIPIGEGVYEVEFTYPREGKYIVLIEARSIGVSYGDLRNGVAEVVGAKGKP